MHAEYRRDVSHNYLIFHGEDTVNTSSYQVRMLTGNVIPSVLKCRLQGLDGKTMYYYDITSKQSVASFYEQRKLRAEDLAMILKGFIRVMEEMAEFLMNADQLVLSPDYMFLDPGRERVYFCCLPDYHHSVQEQFRELTEYFLPKLEHEDPAAVNLGYGIYRKAMEPGLQLEHIKEAVYQSRHGNHHADGEAHAQRKLNQTDAHERNGADRTVTDVIGTDINIEDMDGINTGNAENRPVTDHAKEKEADDGKAGSRKWKWLLFCAIGVLILLGIVIAEYLGYFPDISVEAVIGGAILLMAVCAGGMRAIEHKKRKEDQSAEWRKKVQREIYRTDEPYFDDVQQPEDEPAGQEKYAEDYQSREGQEDYKNGHNERREEKYDNRFEEKYGETVVLSAGNHAGPASLISREAGELATIYLEKELTVIGKLETASDAVISLPTISRVHARVRKTGEEYYLADLNSRNGTTVNGTLLKPDEEYLLQDEDQVDFAQARYIFLK